jgi:hypothetical protein
MDLLDDIDQPQPPLFSGSLSSSTDNLWGDSLLDATTSASATLSPSALLFGEEVCRYCNTDGPCGCLASKVVTALTNGSHCVRCKRPVRVCKCDVCAERIGLENLCYFGGRHIPLTAPLYLVTIPSRVTGGAPLEGVPLRSLPTVLAKELLQAAGQSVKQFGDVYKTVREMGGFSNANKVADASIVQFQHSLPERKNFRTVKLDENAIGLVTAILSNRSTGYERVESYGKLVPFVHQFGEIFLVLFCEEIRWRKYAINSAIEMVVRLVVAAFCHVECKTEMTTAVNRVFAEIEASCQGQVQNAEYAARAVACLNAGNVLLAILFKQLSCHERQMWYWRKAFTLRFLRDKISRDDWSDPAEMLSNAMKEASGVRVEEPVQEIFAEVLRPLVDRGALREYREDPQFLLVRREVLEGMAADMKSSKLRSLLKKRPKLDLGDADIAYLFPTTESLESGDVVFVVYGDNGKLMCTKDKPSDVKKIFGRTVVAGAGDLKPYIVATPQGQVGKGVQVVYMGHANVKVEESQCANITPGTWLCTSRDGFAVPEGASPQWTARIGKAVGLPFRHGGKWLVESFVFIGRGEFAMELAELGDHVKFLDLRIGSAESTLVEVKEDQMLAQIAFDVLEKQVRLISEEVKTVQTEVSSHSVRHDGHEVRFGQVETCVVKVQTDHDHLSQRVAAVEGAQRTTTTVTGTEGPQMTFHGETHVNAPIALGDQITDVPHDADLSQLPPPSHTGGKMLFDGPTTNIAPISGGRQISYAKK